MPDTENVLGGGDGLGFDNQCLHDIMVVVIQIAWYHIDIKLHIFAWTCAFQIFRF